MTGEQRFWAQVRYDETGCAVWTGTTRRGYGVFCWRGRQFYAHRVSWALAHEDPPPGFMVCHKCDNPPCVNPEHLFLGTAADNTRNMRAKGRGRGQVYNFLVKGFGQPPK